MTDSNDRTDYAAAAWSRLNTTQRERLLHVAGIAEGRSVDPWDWFDAMEQQFLVEAASRMYLYALPYARFIAPGVPA